MKKGILLGILGTIVVLCMGFYLAAIEGGLPANADAKPPFLEKWIAKKALDAAIVRQAPKGQNPVALNDKNLTEGIRLYAANCAVCHGASDAKASAIALGLYQKAPQLAKYGVGDDEEGEIYWVLFHGIRMTGMPAFRESLSEEEIWKIVLFLKNMDSLPAGPQRIWEAVPSAARAIQSQNKRGVE
jgi:mono/diheme cytochrome c family protein